MICPGGGIGRRTFEGVSRKECKSGPGHHIPGGSVVGSVLFPRSCEQRVTAVRDDTVKVAVIENAVEAGLVGAIQLGALSLMRSFLDSLQVSSSCRGVGE